MAMFREPVRGSASTRSSTEFSEFSDWWLGSGIERFQDFGRGSVAVVEGFFEEWNPA